MRAAAVLLIVAVLLTPGCLEREPPGEGQVLAMAEALLRHRGLAWGPVTGVWPPGSPDADGRRWWQVDFHDHQGRRDPVVLVDADTGWARLPYPGETVRFGIAPVRSRDRDRPATPPVTGDAGTWILVVSTHAAGVDLEAEARRLNRRAERSSLRPLFAVRVTRRGARQVVYGWNGRHGIARDDLVAQYLDRWGEPQPIGWENLADAP